MTKTLIDELPFEIDARIPLQLGRESISSSMVAISELVKNAYDADATEVKLEFVREHGKPTALIISDNGSGMSPSTFKKHWLRIGTPHKTMTEKSRRLSRVLTGAKGLGRLGVDRLSATLTLHSKTCSADSLIELTIDWAKYAKQGISLSEVKHKLYQQPIPLNDAYGSAFSTKSSEGTRLTLTGLKDSWDMDALTALRQQLAFLVSPFASHNDFAIELTTGHPELDGTIGSDSFLDAASWTIKARLLANHKVTVDYYDCARQQADTVEPSSWSEFTGSSPGLKPQSGPLSFELYFIPWEDPKHINHPSFQKKNIKQFMETNQGIRIYRDAFRVRPYGEPDGAGDWLNLSSRAARSPGGMAQGGWRVGGYQVVGAVHISRIHNPKLADQTNREGLVESQALFDLRKFALSAIEGFESRAHKAAKKDKQLTASKIEQTEAKVAEASEKSKKALDTLKSSIQGIHTTPSQTSSPEMRKAIDSMASQIEQLETELKATEAATEASRKAYLERSKELESEKNTLANLASLGILSVAFGHETTQYAISAAGNAREIKHALSVGKIQVDSDHKEKFDSAIEVIVRNTLFIKNFSKFYLSSVRPSRRKRRAVIVSHVLQRTIDVLSSSLERQNITVNVNDKDCNSLKVLAFEIDIESMFVNLLTNAIHAMAKTAKAKRRIDIHFSELDGELQIVFADSGCGIAKAHMGSIFNAMFSTKKDKKGNQEGTGMGLTITKTIVEEHIKGKISVVAKGSLKGAEFTLRLPIRSKGKA